MKYIFYTHSNITSLVISTIVKDLLQKRKTVLIFQGRNAMWPYSYGKECLRNLREYDAFNKYKPTKTRTIGKLLMEKKAYKRQKSTMMDLIGLEDFLLFTPNYQATSMLSNDKLCKGYYYIEEGSLSYLDSDKLMDIPGSNKVFLIISKIIGFHYYPMLYLTNKFKGTFAISEKAFPWNSFKPRNIINVDKEVATNYGYENSKDIIILSYLNESTDYTKKAIISVINILKQTGKNKAYIKFHPQSFINNKEKVEEIASYIKCLDNFTVIILPQDYIVEIDLSYMNTSIYNIFAKSSLDIYANRFGCKSFLIENKDITDGKLTCLFINKKID